MLLVVKYISQLLSSSKRRRGFTLQRNIILECKQTVFSVMSKYISQLAAAREEAVSPNATHSPPFLLQFFLSSNNVGFRGSKTAGLKKDHFAPFLGAAHSCLAFFNLCVHMKLSFLLASDWKMCEVKDTHITIKTPKLIFAFCLLAKSTMNMF